MFKVPFLDGRLMINTKYWLPNEHIILIASEGNEAYKRAFLSEKGLTEGKDFVLAWVFLGANKFLPIYDPKDPSKIIGTQTIWIDESNMHLAAPKWMMRSKQAQSMTEEFDKIVRDIIKRHN